MRTRLALLAMWVGMLLLPVDLGGEISQSLTGADSLNVGSTFELHIASSYPIKSVSIPDTLQSFAIVGNKRSDRKGLNWQVSIVPLKTGALSFPRLGIIPDAPGLAPDSTDAFRVYVLSVLAEGDTLLRDVKPMERYPGQLPLWVYVLWGVIIIALIIYLIVSRPKKVRVEAPKPAPKEVVVAAWELALRELSALEASGLLVAGDWNKVYFRFSEILRGFLERNYRFAALEMTTREIAEIMRGRQITKQQELIAFFRACDKVKFAKLFPDFEEAQGHLQWLKSYFTGFEAQEQAIPHA